MSKTRPKPSPNRKMRPGRNGGQLLAEAGPGRPKLKTLKELAERLEAEGQIDTAQLLTELYKRAKKRDTAAAKLLLESVYGKPHQSVDVTSDGKPIVSLFDVVVNKKDKE